MMVRCTQKKKVRERESNLLFFSCDLNEWRRIVSYASFVGIRMLTK